MAEGDRARLAAVLAADPELEPAARLAPALGRDPDQLADALAVERGRSVKEDLKMGICGEHGGEAKSVAFCDELGLDYVSCSPYRVPLARLAAAQAALAATGAAEYVAAGG